MKTTYIAIFCKYAQDAESLTPSLNTVFVRIKEPSDMRGYKFASAIFCRQWNHVNRNAVEAYEALILRQPELKIK